DAYLDAVAATEDGHRRSCIDRHTRQVRTRSAELSRKDYARHLRNSLDCVIMFLPGEAFLYAACENDPGLIEDSIANGVYIATPTTLIALLKTIAWGWRQQALSDNAEAIRKHGCELYDRIAVFADHFTKVGKELDGAVNCYNQAVGSFESRLLVTARTIGGLGAASSKPLPEIVPVEKQTRALAAIPD